MQTLNGNPIRILLVDDHRSFTDGLRLVIDTQKPKMEVVGKASTKDEAMNLAITLKPDVILLDLDLGDVLAIDFLPELIEETNSKVIILTGSHDPEIHEKSMLRGARGIIIKDAPARIIIEAIESVNGGNVWANRTMLSKLFTQFNQPHKIESAAEKKIAELTKREREIIRVILDYENSTNEEIASRLFISVSTLKNHLTAIYSKLAVKNRFQLMKYAITHNLADHLVERI